MDQQEKHELMEEVIELKNQVLAFLKVHNLKPRGDSINILFSEDLQNPDYKQLWLINEPGVIRVEFKLENIKSKSSELIQGILQKLIDCLQRDNFSNTTGTFYINSDPIKNSCTHYNSIEIKNNKVKLIGAICYCN